MIFDGDWIPKSDNEYQQRLFAMAVLLVKAAGGEIIIPEGLLATIPEKGTILHQDRSKIDGSLRVYVTHTDAGVPE